MPDLDVRAYRTGDEEAIAALFAVVFGEPMSSQWWRWRYADNPAGPGIVWLAWDGDRLTGHYALCRVDMARGGEPVPAALSMHTMTHPDYQRRGIFTALAEAAYADAARRGVRLVYGFPNDSSYPGFVQKLGWTDLGDLIEWRRQIGDEVAPSVMLAAGATAFPPSDTGLLAVHRTLRYLAWRYHANPTTRYVALDVHVRGEWRGSAVMKLYRATDETRAHLVEYAVSPSMPSDHGAILAALGQNARRRGADVLSAWSLPGMETTDIYRRAGLTPSGFATHFGGRVLAADEPPLSRDRLYVTMGDSDVF